ncbi:CapA family protein [Tangfeifania diversioriginum]|nr:CapA family protein [Tangfeifania diversioriginum]
MKIAFTGDLFLGGDLLGCKDYSSLEIQAFKQADIRVCNLEQGSGDNQEELNKSTVTAPLKSLSYLTENSINIVSLANNHIQDKGTDGFEQKIQFLQDNGIRFTGAGRNIHEASKAIELGDGYFVLSFCTFEKSYLKKVQLATSSEFGVNPLTFEQIKKSLDKLPQHAKAILMLHWGRENVWLPPVSDVSFAKKILKLEKVHSIIGMHSHRVQGAIKHQGKQAWFSLGNFLFPNFFVQPRTQMTYPEPIPDKYHTTKEYHPVFSLTYKMWKWSNRVSLLLMFDTSTGNFKRVFVKQQKYKPLVKELNRSTSFFLEIWFSILSAMLNFPRFLYIPFEFMWRKWLTFVRYFNILTFYIFKERKFFSVLKFR